jgi:hypothetical protein
VELYEDLSSRKADPQRVACRTGAVITALKNGMQRLSLHGYASSHYQDNGKKKSTDQVR